MRVGRGRGGSGRRGRFVVGSVGLGKGCCCFFQR